jgi:hypothetical protein
MPRTPRRDEVQISLRVTPETYQALKAAAADEGRSLNKQLERVLEDWLRRRRPPFEYPRVAEGEGPPYRPHGA